MVKLNLSNLSELTRDLIDIESVSGNEEQLADAIEETLSGLPHLSLTRDGNALIAQTNLGREKRVLIAGHIDTVPIADNLPSKLLSFEREQVIWGRGAVDMKAGVAVMLKLAAELSEPKYDISWIFYDQEEIEASKNGLGRLSRNHPERLKGDFAVLCEPTAAVIEGGCNGTMRVELSFAGKKAHSARPWMGDNAIHKLSQTLLFLSSYTPEEIEVEGLRYRESLNAVLVSGGVATNVIPDQAVLTVNYRFAPSRSTASAEAFLRELFPEADLRVVDVAPGALPGLDRPEAMAFLNSVGAEAKAKYGWTDVARFSELGIPAVNYGPGDPNKAHADDEALPVGQIYACEAGLRGWLA
ncbi:MAG: succinyl-diaminopimelate desuccinylase [Actinomycetota bacterium]